MGQDTATIRVPHLDGSTIGYRRGKPYDRTQPTLVLINSFTTSSDLYRPQFQDTTLNSGLNLLALEPFGHGATRSPGEQFTYWDSAIANLQVLQALDIPSAFVLGTSQGGWIATRMALLAPDRIQGIVPLGTSMDYESQASIERGCWNGAEFNTPLIDQLAQPVGDDWAPSPEYCDALLEAGLGTRVSPDERAFWHATIRRNYAGDAGRRRLRVCAINLRDRDGLSARLDAVTCPVLWLHGTEDKVYSVANAEHGLKQFTHSRCAELKIVQGGQHFLSASDPERVNAESLAFVRRWLA